MILLDKGENMKNKLNQVTKSLNGFTKKIESKLLSLVNLKKLIKKKKSKKIFGLLEVSILIMLTMTFSLAMGGFLSFRFIAKENKATISTEMNEFIKNYNYIKDNYYMDVKDNTMLDAAIKGLLESLQDPYSTYIENTSNFTLYLDGSFIGVGVQINNTDDGISIIKVFDDSPAKVKGLKVNDIIISVNGEDFTDQPASAVPTYVKNHAGPFTIKVLRDGVEKVFTMEKALVIIPSVSHKLYNRGTEKIGYIKVEIFSETTYSQFKSALDDLKKQGMTSLIIDVRDNSGGHLSAVADMASLFLKNDKIIYKTQAKDITKDIYSTGRSNADYPIVFLANNASASASELFIAALKDNLGAKVFGTVTYGKGTIQELHNLSENTSYKITIKKWLTPNGTWIHGTGIAPDYHVLPNDAYNSNPIEANDNQLHDAINNLIK